MKILITTPWSASLDHKVHQATCQYFGRPDVTITNTHGCLIANQRNVAWCQALNDGFTHVVMIDSDIVPQEGWLDAMLDEMETHGADILSAVSPIKDGVGDTSMATELNGHLTRMSMGHATSLPHTFCADDLGMPFGTRLAVNTGLMLCNLEKEWARRAWFEINDGIRQDQNGMYYPVVMPEDWNFSLMAATFGAKVYATNAVKLRHRGVHEWSTY